MASPKAKYSKRASSVTNPTVSATIAVEPHNTIPTANGISTAAVATRFQVIEKDSPDNSRPSSHHIGSNKSRKRVGPTFLSVQINVGQAFLLVLFVRSPDTQPTYCWMNLTLFPSASFTYISLLPQV